MREQEDQVFLRRVALQLAGAARMLDGDFDGRVDLGREARERRARLVGQDVAFQAQPANQTPRPARLAAGIVFAEQIAVVGDFRLQLLSQRQRFVEPDFLLSRGGAGHVFLHHFLDETVLVAEVIVDVGGRDAELLGDHAKRCLVIAVRDQELLRQILDAVVHRRFLGAALVLSVLSF